MPVPCSVCARLSRECVISSSESDRCAECVLRGRSDCDALVIHRDQLFAIARENDRLDSALEEAVEEFERAGAKLRQLQRQKKFWRERMSIAISRGLKSVEALEELEEVERREEEERQRRESEEQQHHDSSAASVPSGDSFLAFDLNAVFQDPSLDPSLFSLGSPSLVDPGVSGGTGQSSQHNSSGA
jgi:hypothetical protein